MDITTLFKACVKTIRTRNKAFGVNEDVDKSRNVLLRKSSKSYFESKSKEIVGHITSLKDLLLEHRKAYLNFASHLSDTPPMSDIDRDKIDSGAQEIMATCSHRIQVFKKEFQHSEGSAQVIEHQKAVLELMEAYLKVVCKIYSEQRVIRVKRSMEMQKLSKLELGPKLVRNMTPTASVSSSSGTENQVNTMKRHHYETEVVENNDELLSAEEMQLFESENSQLYNELNSLTEEVKQIESKVVHIAELQEIFTEKVLQQEVDIDRIAATAISTTENVKDANEQIRQAIQRNAGLRIWVLFFLLIMSLSLLFLDWYND